MGADAVVESLDKGCINWSLGFVEATGIGRIPERDAGNAEMELKSARVRAAAHLFETIRHLRIDAGTTLGDLLESESPYRERVQKMVASAQVVDHKTLGNGAVVATLRMTFHGGFSQFLLPREITQMDNIRRLTPEVNPPSSHGTAVGQRQSPPEAVFTGLVVDAKGLGATPAMSPVVYDESGKEVFGPAFISREYAVQHGVCGYGKSISLAMAHMRVGDNPLLVKGLHTKDPGMSDIVISNTDAAKIRGASHNLSFLKKCQVLIVLD